MIPGEHKKLEELSEDQKLEISEAAKYDYLVASCNYGSDFHRDKQVIRTTKELGHVSVVYSQIISWGGKQDRPFKVLDVGSGPGGCMSWLIAQGVDAYGVDISKEFIKISQSNFPEIRGKVFKGNAKKLKRFSDSSFDLVQHLDGMEHIPKEWEEDCLKEAVRVSRQYVVHEIACEDAWADGGCINNGFSAAHINVKTSEEWLRFYESHSSSLNYKIIAKYLTKEYLAVILKKV